MEPHQQKNVRPNLDPHDEVEGEKVQEEEKTGKAPRAPEAGKAVQVVDFEKGEGGLQHLVVKEELKIILEKLGERPVSIVCITGPTRTGKSFIPSFMIRYLRWMSIKTNSNTHTDDVTTPSWMDDQQTDPKSPDQTESMDGVSEEPQDGFHWRGGPRRETCGMWLWSEPFTLTSSRPTGNDQDDGEKSGSFKFDVLLMDTQGIFDNHTSNREWNIIIGLSLVTSSSLIFNQFRSLDENIMGCLNTYFSIGAMVTAQSDQQQQEEVRVKFNEATKPSSHDNRDDDLVVQFENLILLIRDWPYGRQYPFGMEGGQKYLDEEIFNDCGTHSSNLVRDRIRSAFRKIECCVMPNPGRMVDDGEYRGPPSLLDSRFSVEIKTFIETILDPQKIPWMTIDGSHVLRGRDIFKNFQKYVQLFNKTPNFKGLHEVYAETLVDSLVTAARVMYKKEMYGQMKMTSGSPKKGGEGPDMMAYFKVSDIKNEHDLAQKRVVNHYQNLGQLRSKKIFSEFTKKLLPALQIEVESIIRDNDQILEARVQMAGNFFRQFIQEKMDNNCTTHYFDPDDLTQIFKDGNLTARQNLLSQCGRKEGYMKNILDGDVKLEDQFQNIQKSFNLDNTNKRLEAIESLRRMVFENFQNFEISTNHLLENSVQIVADKLEKFIYLPNSLSQKIYDETKKSFLDQFSSFLNKFPPKVSEVQQILLELEAGMAQKLQKIQDHNYATWSTEMGVMMENFEVAIKNKKIHHSQPMREEDLKEIFENLFKLHCTTKLDTLQSDLKPLLKSFPVDITLDFDQLGHQMKEKFDQKCDAYRKENDVKVQLLEQNLKQFVTQLTLNFENTMTSLIIRDKVMTHKGLTSLSQGEKKKNFETLKISSKFKNFHLLPRYEMELAKKMEGVIQNGKFMEELTKQKLKFLKTQLTTCVDLYVKKMETENGIHRPGFDALDKKCEVEVITHFLKTALLQASPTNEEKEEWHKRLKDGVASARQKLVKIFDARVAEVELDLEKSVQHSMEKYSEIFQETQMTSNGLFYPNPDNFVDQTCLAEQGALEIFEAGTALLGLTIDLECAEDRIEKFRKILKEKINQKCEILKNINKQNLQHFRNNLQEIFRECSKFYKTQFNFDSANQAKFQEAVPTARQETLKEFRSKLAQILPPLSGPHVEELVDNFARDNLSQFHASAVTDFEDFLEDRRQNVENAFSRVSTSYKIEMTSYMEGKEFHAKSDLERKHRVICGDLIRDEIDLTNSIYLDSCGRSDLHVHLGGLYQKILKDYHKKFVTDNYAIGIDLGTTNSCVAVYIKGGQEGTEGRLRVLGTGEKKIVPSFVYFQKIEENAQGGNTRAPHQCVAVGEAAKRAAETDYANTIFEAKRLIGRSFDDPDVQRDSKRWPFEVIEVKNEPMIKVPSRPNKLFKPHEISAEILKEMKRIASIKGVLPCPVTDGVITVPAYFNQNQREATMKAGKMAGLNVHLLNEPTAAVIAYNLEAVEVINQNVVVFDLGGGTFDVSVFNLQKGQVTVLATGGDTHLGGGDFDNNLFDFCIQQFQLSNRLTHPLPTDFRGERIEVEKFKILKRNHRLRSACEFAKIQLSQLLEHSIDLGNFVDSIDLRVRVSRQKFEELNDPLFKKCIHTMNEVVRASKIKWKNINTIILVGGSTEIPKIVTMIREAVKPHSPTILETLNKAEVVARGAAIHAAILSGEHQAARGLIKVLDVTPIPIGVGYYGDKFVIYFDKNCPIPCETSKVAVTAEDNQTCVLFSVYEGEDGVASKNCLLGEFLIDGIPKAPAGQEKFNIHMRLDTNGVLHVDAANVASPHLKNDIVISRHSLRPIQKI